MKVLAYKSEAEKVAGVKELMRSIGNRIGSVYFFKRSDGSRRRMSYRVRVQKPTYAKAPNGKGKKHKAINEKKGLITVFDTNSLIYDKKGGMCGRGGWRSVPLNSVYRLKVNGQVYKII